MTETLSKTLPPLLIPAFRPEEKLITLVEQLLLTQYPLIIAVDDGSGEEKKHIFQKISHMERVIVLSHEHNQGKGAALKTGMKYIFEQKKYPGVVTLDADGQHLPQDVLKISLAMIEHPNELILGCRNFGSEVPMRSQFGNILTKHIFGLFVGLTISDTQTGLRGIPIEIIPDLINLKTGRYEFELDMLIKASNLSIPFYEIPITTVYENNNKGSHFNPIIDSLRIYFVFFRFTFSSIMTALLDFIVFTLVHYFTKSIGISMFCSRLIAATFNFIFVRMVVFKHHGNVILSALKFSLLVLLMGILSYRLITIFVHNFHLPVIPSKAFVETFLFLANFLIQRLFIFNKKIRRH